VTFALPKHGLVHPPGALYAGDVEVADIGIPASVIAQLDLEAEVLSPGDVAGWVTERPMDSHKGTYGHVLVIGGSPSMSGAALLASLGAFAGGAGLVSLATDEETRAILAGKRPEIMITALGDVAGEADSVLAVLEGKTSIVMGPGMGSSEGTRRIIERVLASSACPVVLDADALNVYAGSAEALRDAASPCILTPHPGELARLLGCDAATVQGDRPSAARALAALTGAIVILKGANTLIADPSGHLVATLVGNAGMATAGSGDVLAGVVGALVARRHPMESAVLGVMVHGLAGDVCASETSQESLTATDILQGIPVAWSALHEKG
jgi:NAD(P)H-hydrate epimerase